LMNIIQSKQLKFWKQQIPLVLKWVTFSHIRIMQSRPTFDIFYLDPHLNNAIDSIEITEVTLPEAS
jgi:hypothetical protein